MSCRSLVLLFSAPLGAYAADPPSSCDPSGDWTIELPTTGPQPFSSGARLSREGPVLCAEHPGGVVNARLTARISDGVLRVQWISQAALDALASGGQRGPLVPALGAPAPPPPPCDRPLPPSGLGDGLPSALRDPWGYTCTMNPARCDVLECSFFAGADERTMGTFRMSR